MPTSTPEHSSQAAAWREAVQGASDAELATLLELRPDLALRGARSLEELAARVLEPSSLAFLHGQVDRTNQQLLEALCLLEPVTTAGAVEALLGAGPGALDPFLARLASAFVVRPSGGKLLVNPGLAAAVGRPGRLGPPLGRLLPGQAADQLREVARRAGIEVPRTKAETVELLLERYAQPETVGRLLDEGPEGTRLLAERVAKDGPEVGLPLEAQLLARNDDTPVGYLLRRGLLVSVGWRRAAMPAEVALALRGRRLFTDFRLEPPPLELSGSLAGAGASAAEAARQVVADLDLLLERWGAEPPKLLQSGGLGVRELRRAAKAVGRDETSLARLVELAAGAQLLDIDPLEDVALPTPAYDAWRERPTSERWAALAARWLCAPVHIGLVGSPGEGGKPVPPLLDRDLEPEVIGRRQAVLELLSALPEGSVASRESLAERLVWQRPAAWDGGPAAPSTLVGWLLEEAELLGATSGGQLSPFFRALLDDGADKAAASLAEHLPPLVEDLVLQADLTALATGELRPDLRAELELLAEVEPAGAANLWRFTPRSLERALDAGRSGEEILAFLERHARKGVPQPLAYLVADTARRFGRLRVGAASCYVRADDPSLLAELVRARQVSRLRLRLLAPTVACSPVRPDAAVAALREAGYLAAAEDEEGCLLLTRPVVRRAGGRGGPGEGAEWDLDGASTAEADLAELVQLLEDAPDFVAALTGVPDELVKAMGAAIAGAEGAALPGDPLELVRRLRAGGTDARRPGGVGAGGGRPGPGPAAGPRPEPATQLRLVEDLSGRPSRIGRSEAEVLALLEQALEQDWLVRVSCSNGKGQRRELDAEVIGLDRRQVTVQRLPRGDVQEIALARVHWVRVLTEAEEEARG